LDAEVGSLDEPNTLGYFPQDSEHVYPINDLPQELAQKIPGYM
jgi:hypothetical protein